MPVEVIFNESFHKKLNSDSYKKAVADTVSGTAERTMEECQNECPVRTGNLRDNHNVESEDMTASITNSAYYWPYVVYGTSRQSPNNYPQRAWNTIITQKIIDEIFKEKLNENGIDLG